MITGRRDHDDRTPNTRRVGADAIGASFSNVQAVAQGLPSPGVMWLSFVACLTVLILRSLFF